MKTNGDHTTDTLRTDVSYGHPGLTKREYFASTAMQAYLSAAVGKTFAGDLFSACASDAVKAADALIEALNREADND